MKTLERNIAVSKDISNTYAEALSSGYDLYACVGRNGRYGFNGTSHYELTSKNAVMFEGKLYAATPQYENTLTAHTETPDTNEAIAITQDGENAPETARIEMVEESLTDDITVGETANEAAIEGDSDKFEEDEIDGDEDEDFSDENELEEKNGALLMEIERLTIEVNNYKPLAEKYLAHKELIDSIEQHTAEANETYIEEISTLKNRLDRIKAVIEEA